MKWKRKLSIVAVAFICLLGILITWRISITAVTRHRLEAITARGEPADAAALNTFYKAVADPENAALLWLDGVAAVAPNPANTSVWGGITLPRRGVRTDAEQLERAKGLISSNQEAIAIFYRASTLPLSRYQVNLAAGLLADLGHLSKVKSAAQVLRVQAFVATEQGDTRGLIEAILAILAAGQSLKAEPTMLSQIVRYAIDNIAFNTLEFALNRTRVDDARLDELAAAFAKSDDPQSLALALIGERAFFVSYVSDPKPYIAAGGGAPSSAAEDTFADAFAWPIFRATGLLQWELRFGVDALTTNIAFARLPDPQKFLSLTNSVELEASAKKRYHILTALLLPALDKGFRRDALHRTHARLAQAALAVERYRAEHNDHPPDRLPDLIPKYLAAIPIDPFDGRSMRYKRTDGGYVVYSVGPDTNDDGGLEKPPKAKQNDPWDVTFIVERK